MLVTQQAALDGQYLTMQYLGLPVVAFKKGDAPKAADGFERLRILGSQCLALQIQRTLQLLLCLLVQSEVYVGLPDSVPNGCLNLRLAFELSRDSCRGAIQGRTHLQIGIGFCGRPSLSI